GGIQRLGARPVDVVITSFDGIDYGEITTGQYHEVSEKIINLRPHAKCKCVIIAMMWSKIGETGNEVVEEEDGKGTEQIIDCKKWRYVIITNPPSEEEWNEERNVEKRKILKYWHDKGVEIIPEEIVVGA
ncbi:unnamed protein product, partial [marine sediment metagenome]